MDREGQILHNKLFVRKIVNKIVLYTLLVAVAVFLIFPYIFMINRSFMTSKEIMGSEIKFFPSVWTVSAYVKMFSQQNYLLYTLNTLKVVVFNIIAVPFSASLCAYGFAKIKFRGRKIVFMLVLSTIMIPGAVTQVPLYVLFSNLGWTESVLPLTIPALFGGGAINIFLMMQFMRGVSNEIEEAAKIDGAGYLRRYFYIMIPLCLPILLYVAVGAFGSNWSDFYGPLVYLRDSNSYTLAVAIYYDSITTNVAMESANVRMAAGVFMSIPPALLFLLYQRKLVDGIQMGAVKA